MAIESIQSIAPAQQPAIQGAVQAKDQQEVEGQAAVHLIKSADEGSTHSDQGHTGQHLDVLA